MKLASLLLGALTALFSISAQAAIGPVDFDVTGAPGAGKYFVDMGYVPDGQYGTINTVPFFGLYDYVAEGRLAGNTTITFTYNIEPSPVADWNGPVDFWYTPNVPDADYLVTTTQNFDTNVFTLAIANLVDSVLSFTAGIQLAGFVGTVDTTYNAVSNVPLPAALPLFGLGLVGLAGYRRIKKAAV